MAGRTSRLEGRSRQGRNRQWCRLFVEESRRPNDSNPAPMKVGDPEFGTIEVAFELMVQAGGRQAVAEVFGYPMTLDRDRTGQ